MKPHDSIRAVRKWRGMHADPILRCLDDIEGLNNGHSPSRCSPRVHKLANSLRLGTKSGSEWSIGSLFGGESQPWQASLHRIRQGLMPLLTFLMQLCKRIELLM
jgi:hypothetical protein